jgi:hypothetical protein
MRSVGNQRAARTISLALAAGLVVFQAVVVLGANAIGVPGLLLVRFTGDGAKEATANAGNNVNSTQIVPVAQTAQADDKVPVPDSKVADGKAASALAASETVIAKLGDSDTTPTGSLAPPVPPEEPTLSAHQFKSLAEIPLEARQDEKPNAEQDEKPKDEDDEKVKKPPASKPFDAAASLSEQLPWGDVEPVPFSPNDDSPSAKVEASVAANGSSRATPMPLPPSSEIGGWVKAKATQIKGEARERPLYHFELWLDAPDAVKKRLALVLYDFNTPAVQPQSQMSNEEETGFRVGVGALACADKITVTLTFRDGRSQHVDVDGCKLLG